MHPRRWRLSACGLSIPCHAHSLVKAPALHCLAVYVLNVVQFWRVWLEQRTAQSLRRRRSRSAPSIALPHTQILLRRPAMTHGAPTKEGNVPRLWFWCGWTVWLSTRGLSRTEKTKERDVLTKFETAQSPLVRALDQPPRATTVANRLNPNRHQPNRGAIPYGYTLFLLSGRAGSLASRRRGQA